MNCRDLEERVATYAAGAPIPRDAARHLAECANCMRLLEALQRAEAADIPSRDTMAQAVERIARDLRPVKPLAPAWMLAAGLLLAFGAVVAVGAGLLGPAGWRALDPAGRALVFSVLAAGAGLLAIALGRVVAPGARLPAAPAIAVPGLLAAAGLVFVARFHAVAEPAFVAGGLVCLRIGLEAAALAAVLAAIVLRRGAVCDRAAAGALAGTFAGLAGLAVLETICPNHNLLHILAWHLGPAVLAASAGLLLGIAAGKRNNAG